ncbi:MAG: hypothetical protein FJY65_06475, partial [Calditrichaeota bacterium]|nr:hypothetical protein [Calditrichota bacterium]
MKYRFIIITLVLNVLPVLGQPLRDDFGDVLRQFNTPYNNVGGAAWDGEYIWFGCRSGQRHLWAMNPENLQVVQGRDYGLNMADGIGLGFDPVEGVFWYNESNGTVRIFNRNGEQVRQMQLPRSGHWDFCTDREFIYGTSEGPGGEGDPNAFRIYKLSRQAQVIQEGPNLRTLVNHGRALAIEYVPAHPEGRFWLMSTGYISQINIDWQNNRAQVIREFQTRNNDYPHMGLAHDGHSLYAGGAWGGQVGYNYDDGQRETYGVLSLEFDAFEFGPVSQGNVVQIRFNIANAAQQEDELHRLSFSLSDAGPGPDWLTIEPEEGVINARQSVEITLTANTEAVDLGEYNRTITLECNDPEHRQAQIPVHIFIVEGFGRLYGRIIDAANDRPVEGAILAVEHFGIADTTEEDGRYEFADLPAWNYDFNLTRVNYLPQRHQINVGAGDEIERNFALLHSVCEPRPARLEFAVPTDDVLRTSLAIRNPGNGTLTWTAERLFPEQARADPWTLRANIPAGQTLGD